MRGHRVRALAAALLAVALSTTTQRAMAIEEPEYTVVRTVGESADGAGFEIRDYRPYVVAEVEVPGRADDAGSVAFPILAGYIFGRNEGARKLEMTAPVVQSVAARPASPLVQGAVPGGHLVQFVLPKGVTTATAPVPTDARVHVRAEPARRYAVVRYGGFWSQENDQEHLRGLEAALAAAGLKSVGPPLFARYDPPFKPWFLRRNEIWLPLDPH